MHQNLKNLAWIGDLSLEDADVLAGYARRSSQALEFGAGGSTQILAQCCKESVVSVETSSHWVALTKKRLDKLPTQVPVTFVDYQTEFDRMFDLIFVDGVYHLRQGFAFDTWKNLRVGGVMLFHDTRRWWDVEYALDTAKKFSNQVKQIDINACASNGVSSNITVLHKKIEEPYVNWNELENKPIWAYGAVPDTEDYPLWSYNERV